MNDIPTTTDGSTGDTYQPSSQFRPVTPPIDAERVAFGPPPPTYESHFAESPTDDVDLMLTSSSPGNPNVNEAQPQTHALLVPPAMASNATFSSSNDTSHPRKQRSRKSSTVSTTSIRTSRSTFGRGTSTWKPGAPFLSSGPGINMNSGGGEGRAVVSAVTINAAGSISGIDDAGANATAPVSRAPTHVRSKTTSAVASPSLTLAPPLPAMATSSSGSATLEPHTASSTSHMASPTLAIPSTPNSPASSSQIRLSPSISRLRSIANNSRRRDSLSSSTPASPAISTSAVVEPSSPSPSAGSSTTTLVNPVSASPALSTTRTMVPNERSSTTTSPNPMKGVTPMGGRAAASVVLTTGVVEGTRGDVEEGPSKMGNDARETIGKEPPKPNDSANSPSTFKSRIPTPSTIRPRTTSTKLTNRRSMSLKSPAVADTTSISKMGEIASEGGGMVLVGMISEAMEGVGEIRKLTSTSGMGLGSGLGLGSTLREMDSDDKKRAEVAEREVPWLDPAYPADAPKDTEVPALLKGWGKEVNTDVKGKGREMEKERETSRDVSPTRATVGSGSVPGSIGTPDPTPALIPSTIPKPTASIPTTAAPQSPPSKTATKLPVLADRNRNRPTPVMVQTHERDKERVGDKMKRWKESTGWVEEVEERGGVAALVKEGRKEAQAAGKEAKGETRVKKPVVDVSKGQPAKKDWFSSLTRSKGKAVASIGVAMVQSESSEKRAEGEERDVKSMLEDIHAAHSSAVVDKVESGVVDMQGPVDVNEGGDEGIATDSRSTPPVEINVLPATPQLDLAGPMFAMPDEATSSSVSLPLPSDANEVEPIETHLASQSSPSLPLQDQFTSPPPSLARSPPRTISVSHSRSVPHTPQRKSRSWFSSPLSGSPLGVSVFTAARGNADNDNVVEESPTSDDTFASQPPGYIPPPPIDDDPTPPSYAHPPPPPPPTNDANKPSTHLHRSDSLPSLDSTVPSLPTTPPASAANARSSFAHAQSDGGPPLLQRKSSTASLNASSGRFLLSFGLHGILGLGREREKSKERSEVKSEVKEGGESSMGVGESELKGLEGVAMERTESEDTAVPDVKDAAGSSSVSVASMSSQDASTSDNEEEDLSATIRGRPEKTDKARGKERAVEGEEKSTSRTRANGNGWWGMVGWGSTVGVSVEEAGRVLVDVKDDEVGNGGLKQDEALVEGKSVEDEREGGGTVKGIPLACENGRGDAEDIKDVDAPEAPVKPMEGPAVSTTTTEKGVVAANSVWFAKWTWYGAGDIGGSEVEANRVDEGRDQNVDAEIDTSDGKDILPETTEPETHNGGALLVHTDAIPPTDSTAPTQPDQRTFDDNPLTSTMTTAAQRSIWSSLFNSTYAKSVGKAGTMKAIEDGRAIENVERDEHGAEVMDIESDDEVPTKDESTPSLPKSPERASRGWAGPMRMMVAAVSSSSTSRDASVERRQNTVSGPKNTTSSQNGNNSDFTGLSATTTTATTTTATNNAKDMVNDASNGKDGVTGGQKSVSGSSRSDTTKPTASTGSTTSTTGSSSITTTTISTFTSLTKRTASPAPSTASSNGASSKPSGPPPPNLVLPTWEDTFFVPPRNYVDPPLTPTPQSRPASPGEESVLSKGLLGGALRLVTGVLGSPQFPPAPAPSQPSTSRRRGSSRPPSPHHEPPNPLRYFGRELPKAYQVLEEAGYDTSAPPDYSPSPAYTNLSPPPHFSPRQPGSPSLPRSPNPGLPASPPKTAASGFSFFGGGPKRAASPPPEMPEPAKMDEVKDVLRGCKRVVVIGVHGWFPGAMIRTVLGEPTGTSSKFANMMSLALHQFELEMDVKFEKVTKVILEGEGEVKRRVDKLYSTLLAHPTHLTDIHRADAILVATHSQGSVVSTHILDRLIKDGHIVTRQSLASRMFGDSGNGSESGADERQGEVLGVGGEVYPSSLTGLPSPASSATPSISTPSATANADGLPRSADVDAPPLSARSTSTASTFDDTKPRKPQRVCCLAMCGIHLGPLRYLSTSGFVGPYIQYLESHAARELFEFQNTESAVSKAYVKALEGILDAGVKMVYVASLNDQVVPIYSGLFTAVHHPSILRALYIDGDAYSTSDFLCALIVLLIRIINSGLPDSGLIAHLSEATAGSLSGVGHSAAYEELATYVLAVKYLFLVDEGAMSNVNAGPAEIHSQPLSPVSPPAHIPYFLSPTFSAFSPHLHSPIPHSSSSSSLPPLPKPRMIFTPFSAHMERNDYEIPWSLRDLIAHPVISYLFHREIEELRDKFGEWNPKTAVLRDVKRKVSPIARLGSMSMGVGGMHGFGFGTGGSSTAGSKL